MSTLDLVSAIINKDAVGIETAFNTAMGEKIASRLEDMRTNVAQTMFNTPEEVNIEEPVASEQE
jgi:hypothetical protein